MPKVHAIPTPPVVDVFPSAIIVPKLRAFLQDMVTGLNEISNNGVELLLEKQHHKIGDCDLARFISEKTYSDKTQHMFRNILLNTVYQSQNVSGLAGYIAFHCALTTSQILLQVNEHTLNNANQEWIDLYIKNISKLTTQAEIEHIDQLYQQMSSNKLARSLTRSARKFAGLAGQITFNKTCNTRTHLNILNGSHFTCSTLPEFWYIQQSNTWQQSHVICVIIDGIIETVGEIHKILQYLNENKTPAVFFARGYSEEVIATLGTNTQRKTLDVIPVIVPYTPEHMNTLNDLATVCGCDVISSLKGELISSIPIEKYSLVDNIKINSQNVIIINEKTKDTVNTHIAHLTQQNMEMQVEENKSGNSPTAVIEKSKLIEARIQALSTRCVIIAIGPKHAPLKGIITDHIKAMLSITNNLAYFGIVNCDDIINSLLEMPMTPYKKSMHKVFTTIKNKYKYLPFHDVMIGIRNGIVCAHQIKNVGASIVFK